MPALGPSGGRCGLAPRLLPPPPRPTAGPFLVGEHGRRFQRRTGGARAEPWEPGRFPRLLSRGDQARQAGVIAPGGALRNEPSLELCGSSPPAPSLGADRGEATRQSTPNPVLARSGATKQSPERFGPRPVLSLRGAKRRGNLWSASAPTRPPEIAASRPSGPFLAMTWWGGLSRRVLRAAPPNDRQRELGSRGEGVKPRVLLGVASLLWTLAEAWILYRDALEPAPLLPTGRRGG